MSSKDPTQFSVITRCQISFSVRGYGFNPAEHDIPWTKTDLAETDEGLWGSGTIYHDLPSLAAQEEAIRNLHALFLPRLPALRGSGETTLDLFITWTYESQCAGEFSGNEMRWIAELGCGLALDCENAGV